MTFKDLSSANLSQSGRHQSSSKTEGHCSNPQLRFLFAGIFSHHCQLCNYGNTRILGFLSIASGFLWWNAVGTRYKMSFFL